jgi:hypothetical protein
MSVLYTPRVQWPQNELLLDAKKHLVTVPTGLKDEQVRTPNFVDVTAIGAKTREGALGTSGGGGLSIVNGLVTRNLEIHFSDPATQWKRLSTGTTGPGQFQFQGGEIYLDLTLAMYVLAHLEPDPKDLVSRKIFAVIYGHELLHVYDENAIVRKWLPTELLGDRTISDLLAKPYTYGRSADSIVIVEKDFHEYMRRKIESIAFNDYWAPKTNEKKNVRDAKAEYQKVQDAVDDLRASRTMGR